MSASNSQLAFLIDERQLSRSETPKVEETAVCSETDVDESGRFSFASRSMMVKKMENNVGVRTNASLLDAETHCASPDLADLHGADRGW